MKKDNDPRHEIAMAIHHVAGLAQNWQDSLKVAVDPDGAFALIAENQIVELEAAKSWLEQAQKKVN
tara:strand:- start:668 stop:865 length:198 start_codon:yes stop_codon:yes gene_type:complete